MLIRMDFDTSVLINQMNELRELLKSSFLEDIPSKLFGDLEGLLPEVILSQSCPTTGTDSTHIVLIQPQFSVLGLERLATALQANKGNLGHGSPPK
jgi:hypothetical protein